MTSKARWLLIANILMVVVLVLGACGTPVPPPPADTPVPPPPGETPEPQPTTPPPPPPPPPVEIKNPDTFVWCSIGDPATFDPSWAYDTASHEMQWQVYEYPIMLKRETLDEFVPMLATDWEISNDQTEYTLTMREGVTFHEGGTMEPHDLAYSTWRSMIQDRSGGPVWILLEPLLGYSAIEDLAEEVGDVAACEAVKDSVTYDDDAGTVTFHLVEPFGPWLQIMTSFTPVMDMEWVIEVGGWDGDCATWRDWHDPVREESELFDIMNGTGPYILEYWTPNEEVSFVRNDDYWLEEPLWEGGPSGPAVMGRALYKNVSEWSTRLAMLEAGDCDYVYVPREYIAQVEPMVNEWYVGGEFDADTLTVLNPEGTVRLFTELPSVSSADVFFNQNVNVEGGNALLGSGELNGDGIPADFFSDVHVRRAFNYCFDWDTFIEDIFMGEAFQRTGPIISGIAGYNAEQETFTFDLEACEAEFAEAWDGVLPETGFHLVYVYNSGNESRRAVGEILEANVESVNENYSIAVLDMPWPTFLDMLVDGRMGLFTIGWIEDYHHPHNWVHPYMHSAGAFSGFQGWPEELHEQFDAAIEACVAIADPVEQEQCYFGVQNLAYENVIDIFLTQPVGRHYEQMWMQGYFYNPAWFGFYPYAQVTGKGF